jgi:uncharacterized protein (TIGR03435 family)
MKIYSADYICSMILMLLAMLPAVHGQALIFEVASIKPAPPGSFRQSARGGPGTRDPGRWTCESISLQNLVSEAFDVRGFRLQAPSWLDNERFNIMAKIQEGVTKDQFKHMQQNLLIERFGLKFHHEKREIQGYELVVSKNGPKFKESEPEPIKPTADAAHPATPPIGDSISNITIGNDGVLTPPPGVTFIMNGRARYQGVRVTMEGIAKLVSGQVGKPVKDSTRLGGQYDFSLYWIPEAMGNVVSPMPGAESAVSEFSAGPSIFTALQEQLGLKLQQKKVTTDVLAVDHIEKTPTEN